MGCCVIQVATFIAKTGLCLDGSSIGLVFDAVIKEMR